MELDLDTVYMIPAEVGRQLGLTQLQVKELGWNKTLETVKLAGRIVFYTQEVMDYKQKRKEVA